jgi:hypothetical protein
MKKLVLIKVTILILLILITFIDADCQTSNKMPDIKIKTGIACISGSISNLKLPEGEKKLSISFTVINPVSGVERKYTANLNENNRFKLNIPLECNTALAGFNVESETNRYGYGLADLNQDKMLQLDIVFDEQGNMKMKTKGGMSLNSVELLNIPKALTRFVTKVTWGEYYKMTPKEFSEFELNVNLKKRISFALDSLQFSDEIKKYLSNSFNLQYLK